jgi:hypothetical protein
MNSFIETFAEIRSITSVNSTKIDLQETLESYVHKFDMPYAHIKQMVDLYGERAFSNYLVSITVHDSNQERPLLYDDFLSLSPLLYSQKPNAILTVELKVNKDIAFGLSANEFIFFEMEWFNALFHFHNEQIFERINKNEVVKIYLPIQTELKNEYLHLLPHLHHHLGDLNLDDEALNHIVRILKIRDECCGIYACCTVPEMFLMNNVTDPELKSWFDKNLFGISLCYIGNKMTEPNGVVIRGNKNIEIDLSTDFVLENAKSIYNIYKFSYEEKHQSDKIEIARNVITIYLNTAENASKLNELAPTIEKTIKSHFTAYVQDTIKKFFNDRKDVIKEAHKFASDIKGEADKLMTYINASFLGIVTAFFAGSLGLSKGERWYLLLAFGLHAIAFLLTFLFNQIFVKKKLNDIVRIYDEYTNKFVFLASEELAEIKKIYIVHSVENVNKYLRTYMWVTISLIIFMIVLIWLGVNLPESYFNENSPPKNIFKLI